MQQKSKVLTGCWEECHCSHRFHMLPGRILHSASTCKPDKPSVSVSQLQEVPAQTLVPRSLCATYGSLHFPNCACWAQVYELSGGMSLQLELHAPQVACRHQTILHLCCSDHNCSPLHRCRSKMHMLSGRQGVQPHLAVATA